MARFAAFGVVLVAIGLALFAWREDVERSPEVPERQHREVDEGLGPREVAGRRDAEGPAVDSLPDVSDPGEIGVQPGARRALLRVVVRGPNGPVEGAAVRVTRPAAPGFLVLDPALRDRRTEVAGRATDGRGIADFELARGVLFDVVVNAPGFGVAGADDCYAGRTVRVSVGAPASMSGEVRWAEDRSPVAGADVRITLPGGGGSRSTTSDSEGRYRLDGLPAGRLQVSAVPSEGQVSSGWVDLRAGEDTLRHFELVRGATIVGRVTDAETGEPIRGAFVGTGWAMDRSVTTGADGRYRIVGYPEPGRLGFIGIRCPGFVAQQIGLSDVPSMNGRRVIDFVLKREASVTGRVLSGAADGRPVRDLAVAVQRDVNLSAGIRGFQVLAAEVDPSGTWTVRGLRPGALYEICIFAPGFGGRQLVMPRPCEPGELQRVPDVVLTPGALVVGRILGPEGPVGSVDVILEGHNDDRWVWRSDRKEATSYGARRDAEADVDGVFRFAELAPGRYTLSGTRPTRWSREIEVAAGELVDDLEIRVQTGVTIVGRVVDSEGRGVRGRVHPQLLEDSGRAGLSSALDADGRFEIRDCSPGARYLLSVMASDAQHANTAVEAIGGRADVAIVAPKAASIAGRVVDAEGQPMPGVWVVAGSATEGDSFSESKRTDGAGRFELVVAEGSVVRLGVFVGAEDGAGFQAGRLADPEAVARVVPPIGGLLLRVLGTERK